jgi:hypothetical protein
MNINICFSNSSKKIYFIFVRTYLTPTWNQKLIMKSRCQKLFVFWKTYLKPNFTVWNMKINSHQGKHLSYLVIEMKTFNVPQFYNGFCCYFKSTCSSFDKVINLFILSYLHPYVVFQKDVPCRSPVLDQCLTQWTHISFCVHTCVLMCLDSWTCPMCSCQN